MKRHCQPAAISNPDFGPDSCKITKNNGIYEVTKHLNTIWYQRRMITNFCVRILFFLKSGHYLVEIVLIDGQTYTHMLCKTLYDA